MTVSHRRLMVWYLCIPGEGKEEKQEKWPQKGQMKEAPKPTETQTAAHRVSREGPHQEHYSDFAGLMLSSNQSRRTE